MKINKVTITGADDSVSVDTLLGITRIYPFVEWGILFSPTRTGTNRYPTSDKVESFIKDKLPLSAHLCGQFTRDIFEKGDLAPLQIVKGQFQRVQLNYNFGRSENWEFDHLINVCQWADQFRDISVIFQANKSNDRALTAMIKEYPISDNVHFLYDSSGGRGVGIGELGNPFKNYTGYSGGISDENIFDVIKKVYDFPNNAEVWIDMESGVRTEDIFDISKVHSVLAAISNKIDNL